MAWKKTHPSSLSSNFTDIFAEDLGVKIPFICQIPIEGGPQNQL